MMKAINVTATSAIIELSIDDVYVIRSFVGEVLFGLGSEVSARIGITEDEARAMHDQLNRVASIMDSRERRRQKPLKEQP